MKKLGTPSGFRDMLPEEAQQREYMIQQITDVYKRFGFLPLETPVAEFEDVVVGDKASDFNLFRIESTRERLSSEDKEEIALRFDLTVPLARVVSQYGNSLPRPFKRYQVGSVFRGERPQKGRYRQFMQFDADVVGAKSLLADVEMIQMIAHVMQALSVPKFKIRVNTRTLLNALPEVFGFPSNVLKEVLIVLDKVEKISEKDFEKELERLRLSDSVITNIKKLSLIFGNPNEVVAKLEEFFASHQSAQEGIEELRFIAENITQLGLESCVDFDMRIIRGFGYYTGPVFETNIIGAPEYGSVMSGGRYDNLTERFMNQSLPAVGVSVGVDRLQAALHEMGVFGDILQETRVVIFSTNRDFDSYAVLVAGKARENKDIVVDLYTGAKRDFKDLFSYAESTHAKFLVIVGEEEYTQNKVTIKNNTTREQDMVVFDELSRFF